MAHLTKLRLIQFKAAYNLPVHVAREHGVFERHRLAVDFSYTPGSFYLAEALRKGEFEIGYTGADDVIADVEEHGGAPDGLFLFMGLHSGLVSLVSAPGVNSLEGLCGKALAVDARASGFVFILEKLLRSKGFAPADYDLIEVGGWEKRYQALLDGKCSATLLTPPFVGSALERGCHLLARGDNIVPQYQGTAGAAKRSWAEKNREILVRYIHATIAATQWCFEPQNRSECIALLAKHNGVQGRAAEQTLDALLDRDYGMYPDAKLNLPGLETVLELRAEMGFLARPVPPLEKYVDLSYYQEAVNSLRQ